MEEDPDMDIEETTLMYPRIESIYSDVIIKTEPVDIEEDDYEPVNLTQSSSDYYRPIPNKIILGSKPSSTHVEPDPAAGPSTAPDTWEDVENFLECGECNMLFPTRNELDFHKMSSHSFLVARPLSRAIKTEWDIPAPLTPIPFYNDTTREEKKIAKKQKAMKSTSKSALNHTFPVTKKPSKSPNKNPHVDVNTDPQRAEAIDHDDRFLCKHCDFRFPDEIALIKHTYELLPDRSEVSSPADMPGSLYQCLYCSCYLMNPGPMKRHLLNNHKVSEFAVKQTMYTGKCAICNILIGNYRQYNKHLLHCHQKQFISKTLLRKEMTPVKMKCQICNEVFSSRYAAYKHKALNHPGSSKKHTFRPVYDKLSKLASSDAQLAKVAAKPIPAKNALIPLNNLFKCNKCQIHFVSCSTALVHSKRCTLAKGDWKCNRCRRTFTKVDKTVHLLQHHFSEKFKVHIVNDNMNSKVLCVCPKCEVCFDEVALKGHVSSNCVPGNSVECKSCNLKIHSKSFAKHKIGHSKYNFSSNDFVIIPLIDPSPFKYNTPFVKPLPMKLEAPVKMEETQDHGRKKVLLVCTICKCHTYGVKSRYYHIEGKCALLAGRCCPLCGLGFSVKPFNKHLKEDHETGNFKLDDITFKTLQNSEVINPFMPDFYQCRKCEIRFVSPRLRKTHKCSTQVFLKCDLCLQKYDSSTYDVHLMYHNYRSRKAEPATAPLLLYSCAVCKYGFNSYDGVVEHCQKHYTNLEVQATQKCKLCKLNYAEDHQHLHAGKKSFDVFKFNYEKLLTDDWLDGFGSLPKNAVEEVLSKSVYGFLRNVRLELTAEGPAERTLYKCVQCNINFEGQDVMEHITQPCAKSTKFKCGSCLSAFKTRDATNKHANIHVVYGDDITFRRIAFNDEKDKEQNEALISAKPKESLKFRKCRQCDLLIKKSDYEKHVTEHDTKFVAKQITCLRNGRLLKCTFFKPVNESKKLFTVYRCRSCKASIRSKTNVSAHSCASLVAYTKCRKCFLFILPCFNRKHALLHSTNPKYIRKNISVVEFLVQSGSDSPVKKRRRYSSDDDDPTGLAVSVNVSKTYDTRKMKGKPYNDSLSEDSQDNFAEDSPTGTPEASNTYAKQYVKKKTKKLVSDNDREVYQEEVIEPEEIEEESEIQLDIDSWRMEMKNKLYQCDKCYLLFVRKKLLLKHLSECVSNLPIDALICDRCDLVLHPSLTSFHEKLHELVNQNPIENYIYIINISTNGVHTKQKDRWLYKCKLCDIQYLNTRSLETHFSTNHILQNYLNCEICDLKFTRISRTRHVRIQHNQNKWSKDDLHVEITQKNIVTAGKIHLRPFVKPHLLDETCRIVNAEISVEGPQSAEATPEVECGADTEAPVPKRNENYYNDFNATISLDKVTRLAINHNIFECPKCHKCYLTEYSLLYHMMSTIHQGEAVPCNKCGLSFGKRTLKTHKRVQHKEMNLSLKDFVINKPNENIKIIDVNKKNLLNPDDSNALADQSEVSDIANDDTLQYNNDSQLEVDESQSDQCDDSMAERYKQLGKELQLQTYRGPIDNRIYKCVECSVFYTNRRTLLLHIVVKKHNNFQYVKCDMCGLTFGRGSLIKHKSVQHEQLKLTRNDFVITDVFGSKILDDKNNGESGIYNNSLIETKGPPLLELKEKENEESGEIEKEKEIKNFRLYQCIHCRVCVEKPQRKLHVCCSDIQKRQCIKCCLTFRNTDALYHRRLHRKHRELSRKNFEIMRFGRCPLKANRIYKCETCSTHFVNLTTLEWHMDAFNHQTKRVYCENCGLFFGKNCLSRHVYIHHNKLKLNVDQLKIICVSKKECENNETRKNDDKESSVNTAMSEHNVTQNSNAVRKLFRCVECDVCFLTRASYYNHIYKHKKLDATEYIDCDICDLQFLNEALGVHMKSHRENVCLDKLLIEEYQPNSAESVGVKTYFAKDSVNSKLVSTTTLFDNDEDIAVGQTDEQLSVIDSTSDETHKVTAGDVVDDANDGTVNCPDSVILNQSVVGVPDVNISS